MLNSPSLRDTGQVEAFEYEGIFWPADQPCLRVAGRISYEPTEGARLKLIGAFDEPQIAFNVSGPVRRILGLAGARDVTLDGCFQENANFDSPACSARASTFLWS